MVTHFKVGYKVGKALVIQHPNDFKVTARLEVDSRANTCCFWKTFRLVLEQSDRVADVQGFSGELGSFLDVPIGTCATTIDLTGVQETIINIHRKVFAWN